MKAKVILLASVLLAGCQSQFTYLNKPPKEPNSVELLKTKQDKTIYASLDWLNNSDKSLWQYLSSEINIDVPDNKKVDVERRRYLAHKAYLEDIAQTAEPYMYWIITELKKRDMPVELALLPIVESAFDPNATSTAQATGLWQIVPTTGIYYGLQQNKWYDGRNDVAASTVAALSMLDKLHDMFNGDWLLAIAAYNSGEGRVLNAIKTNKAKGKSTDFWSLDLPQETSVYVPKMLALIDIIKHQDKYGITLPDTDPRRALEQIDIGQQIELHEIAKITGLSISNIKKYNAGYKHLVTPPNGPYTIMLPKLYSRFLEKHIKKQPNVLVERITYVSDDNETIEQIATRYNSNVDAIKVINKLDKNEHLIAKGLTLNIPQFSNEVTASLEKAELSAAKKRITPRKGTYKVVSGDTLSTIAKKLHVRVSDLKEWNKIKDPNKLKLNQPIKYYVYSNNLRKVIYNVNIGDTMTSIAKKYNLDINDVLQWNSELPNIHQLKRGEQLILYVN